MPHLLALYEGRGVNTPKNGHGERAPTFRKGPSDGTGKTAFSLKPSGMSAMSAMCLTLPCKKTVEVHTHIYGTRAKLIADIADIADSCQSPRNPRKDRDP